MSYSDAKNAFQRNHWQGGFLLNYVLGREAGAKAHKAIKQKHFIYNHKFAENWNDCWGDILIAMSEVLNER